MCTFLQQRYLVQVGCDTVDEKAQVVLGLPQQAPQGMAGTAAISREQIKRIILAPACDAPLETTPRLGP